MHTTFALPPTSAPANHSMHLRRIAVNADSASFLGVLKTANHTWQVTLSLTAASSTPTGWLQKKAFWLVNLSRSDEQVELDVTVTMDSRGADLTISSLLTHLQQPNGNILHSAYDAIINAMPVEIR